MKAEVVGNDERTSSVAGSNDAEKGRSWEYRGSVAKREDPVFSPRPVDKLV